MIEQYDTVIAKDDLNDKILKGCKGTVLTVYPDFPTGYIVEFFDNNSITVDWLVVSADNISKVD